MQAQYLGYLLNVWGPVTLYMLLDIAFPYDGDPYDPLVCTPGYLCFEQDCASG